MAAFALLAGMAQVTQDRGSREAGKDGHLWTKHASMIAIALRQPRAFSFFFAVGVCGRRRRGKALAADENPGSHLVRTHMAGAPITTKIRAFLQVSGVRTGSAPRAISTQCGAYPALRK